MCGITGIFAFSEKGKQQLSLVEPSTCQLLRRGPDHHEHVIRPPVALGHSRLSILDLSDKAHQPFSDDEGKYTLVYNGEIYNYPELREQLIKEGITFRSSGDTEVLFHLLKREGMACLEKINGFFSFGFFDHTKNELILARDRYGIKPLHVYNDSDRLIFASEIKAILAYGIDKKIDNTALYAYLQLNYIPAPHTIYQGIEKIPPGCCWQVKANGNIEKKTYYKLPSVSFSPFPGDYQSAQKQLRELMESAVEKRLVADVPVGAFLSGGIDSSVITAIASRHTPHLNTFSMGFSEADFFDETAYAEKVAKALGTNHTSYKISREDLLEQFFEVLNYLDEPFADSSALAVSILSRKTREKAKVALSGDGADELFGGYNKHKATYFACNNSLSTRLLRKAPPFWRLFPGSRDSKLSNLSRQLEKLKAGLASSPKERYWQWATFQTAGWRDALLRNPADQQDIQRLKNELLSAFDQEGEELRQTLLTDVKMVLPDDMLTKVDRMSMMHGLEVRVPFLDPSVVSFAFSLPTSWKINGKATKGILRDAYREQLPGEIYERGKHGFEVPLLDWFRHELKDLIEKDLLSAGLIEAQGLFNYEEIRKLKTRLWSSSPGDAATAVWNLLVFNYWWKNNLSS